MEIYRTARVIRSAQDVAQYFIDTGLNWRAMAKIHGGENVKGLMAVMGGSKWTAADVRRWKEIIKKHERAREKTQTETLVISPKPTRRKKAAKAQVSGNVRKTSGKRKKPKRFRPKR